MWVQVPPWVRNTWKRGRVWLIAPVLKTGVANHHRGFESYRFRATTKYKGKRRSGRAGEVCKTFAFAESVRI